VNTMVSSSSAQPANDDVPHSLRIRAEQIRLLYMQLPGLILGSTAGALLIAFTLWDSTPRNAMIVWLVCVLTLTILFAALWWTYQQSKTKIMGATKWGNHYLMLGILIGCTWGSAGTLLYTPEFFELILFLALILFAATGAVSASTAVYIPAFIVSALPMLVPLMFRFSMQGTVLHLTIALSIVIYLVILIYVVWNLNNTLLGSFRLRFENVDLVQKLSTEREKAEQANIAKSRFLAAASHDLRQPLHALGLFAGALDDQAHTPEMRNTVDNIRSSVSALDSLFNSLLDISKLDAGNITPQVQDFYIDALLDPMRKEYSPKAVENHIKFRVVASNRVVRSDPILLERIVRNLIDNAINYTRKGGVLLGCRWGENAIRIEIRDSGVGIRPDRQQSIFQEFYQIGNPERDRSKGLGLGLAIVDRLAHLLNYPISVSSLPELGSVFSIEIPLGATPTSKHPHSDYPELVTDKLIGCCILVVDDDIAVQKGMQELLESWKCQVSIASSMKEVLAVIENNKHRLDIIVADYQLPGGMNGIQIINHLREHLMVTVPALIVTGDTSTDCLHHIQNSGYPLLHKPVQPAKLRALISSLLS